MGGGITGSKGNPESNKALERISTEYFNMAKPLLQQSQGQVGQILDRGPGQFSTLTPAFQEALRSGASTAYTPAINRASEAAYRAGGQALGQTREDLVRQGYTGSDYNRQLAQALQQQFFNASQAPAPLYASQAQAASQYGYQQAGANQNFYRDILSSFYRALTGAPQIGITGLGTAASNETQTNMANVAAAQQFIGKMQEGLNQAGGSSVPVCWIAAQIYGRYSPEFYYARAWIFTYWQGKTASLTRLLYHRYGEQLSRHPWAVMILKPFFAWSVKKAREVVYHTVL